MALTDVIEEELLVTLKDEVDPQAVLARFAGSKGPLYAASGAGLLTRLGLRVQHA